MKDKVRPIYEALKGLMSSAPLPEKVGYILEQSTWNQYHKFIERLNNDTDENFDDYKLQVLLDQGYDPKISVQEYRSQLSSLIMYLYGKYYSGESQPFSGQPGVLIQQSQNQNVDLQVIIVSQFQDLIDKKLYGEKLEEKEKTFLENVKASLPTVKNIVELIQLIFTMAKSSGLDLSQVTKILGL